MMKDYSIGVNNILESVLRKGKELRKCFAKAIQIKTIIFKEEVGSSACFDRMSAKTCKSFINSFVIKMNRNDI